jgi:Tfp pilus assembly protein PilF
VDAAIAATDTRLAQRLAAEAVAAAPNDPRSHLMAARAARARGNNAEALREFELARSLRRQFLAAQENASP